MEHRWGRRLAAEFPVTLGPPGAPRGIGRITEISSSGARLDSSAPLPAGAVLQICFGAQPVNAYVVRSTEIGFAVEWFEFAPLAVRILLAALTEPDADDRIASPAAGRLPHACLDSDGRRAA